MSCDLCLSHVMSCDACRNQTGTIRSNCLDCLDRSNTVQTFLGLQVCVWGGGVGVLVWFGCGGVV